MALGSKNVIEDKVVLSFQDDMSGPAAAARRSYEREMRGFQKVHTEISQALLSIKSLLLTIFSVRQVKQMFNAMSDFAREHQTAATEAIAKMDRAWNALLTGIANSQWYRNIIENITNALNIGAAMLQNEKVWSAFWDWAGQEMTLKIFSAWSWLLGKLNAVLFGFLDDIANDAAMWKKFAFNMAKVAKEEFDKQLKVTIPNLQYAPEIKPAQFEYRAPKLPEIKPFAENFVPLAGQRGQMEQMTQNFVALGVAMRDYNNEQTRLQTALTQGIAWADQTGDMNMLIEAYNNMRSSTDLALESSKKLQEFIVGVLSTSFQQLGAAIIGMGGGFKHFFKSLLKSFADFGIQIGQFMVAYGIGLIAIKKMSGPQAIAAGLALITIAGAMKAVVSRFGKNNDSGGDVLTPSNYGRSDTSNERKGDTYVTVNVEYGAMQALDLSGLTEKRFREMAYRFGQSWAEQVNDKDRSGR